MVSEEVRAMIPDYVRGLLSPAEAKEVEAALESSPEIYPEFEAAQTYYAALNQIPEVKAPSDFVFRVNQRIDHVPLWPRVGAFLFEPLALKLPFELAGVAACLVVALVLFNPFSSRGRLPSEKSVAVKVRKAAAAEEAKTLPPAAAAPATEEAAAPSAPEPAPGPVPKPPGPAAVAAGLPEVKAETPAPPVPAKPEEIAFVKSPAPEPEPPAAAKRTAAKEAPAPMAEKKADMTAVAAAPAAPAPVASAPAPAAAAPRRPALGKLDAIPTLPSVAMAAPAPRAPAEPAMEAEEAPARAVEAPKPKVSSRAEDIGTIDLAPEEGSLSSADAETAETILSTTVVTCTRTMKDGKTAFLCKLPPDRLDLLIVSLARSFTVTTHLFPYDAAAARMVAVTFVIQ
jgi:hypothetical protein